ncbi:MAG: 6-pyruvoyl-tetrahydropterin synthase-related protein [Rhizorhabdus sp.]
MTFAGRVLSSGKSAPFVILAVSLLLMAPALVNGGSVHGDFYVYARWQAHFAAAVAAGDPYPRWLPELNQGFGSPAFFIYPPLGQWLGALLTPLLPGAALAGLRLHIVLALCLAASGIGVSLWLRLVGLGKPAALVGALAWLLLPYHAYLNLYQRGAFAELVAMAALPWGLAFAHALKQRRMLAWAGLTLSLAALLMSNAPTALFSAPFICLYAVLLADRADWPRLWTATGMSAALAIALSAAWLMPALAQIGMVDHRILFNDVYQPANYLIFSPTPWPNQGVRIAATLIFLLHAVILLLVLLAGGAGRGRALLIVSALLILLAMSELARPMWIAGTPWSKVQFAWRLLGLQSLLLAGLVGMAWQAVGTRWRALSRAALLWLLPALLLIDAALLAALGWHVARRPVWPTPEVAAHRAEVREYWLGDVDALAKHFGSRDSIVMSGRAQVGPIERRGRVLRLESRASEPSLIALRQFAYSGWIVRVDDGPWRQALRLRNLPELVAVAVPAGYHRIELRLPPLPVESRGMFVSGTALLLLLAGVLLVPLKRLLAR